MMNKVTLQFISGNLEKDYRQSQHVLLKEQFTLFTLQTILFFIAYTIYYFEPATYNIIVLANIFGLIILIILLKYVIDSHPSWNEIIFPCLQVYIAYIWNLDNLFPSDNYSNSTTNYDWCYGFQAFYFHFVILQLGYQIWPQVLILIGIYLQYILFYKDSTLEYVAMCSTMFLVFLGIIMTKYTNERTKRKQFIETREKNKWIKIIDDILEQSIVVVGLDKKQDQLHLYQINQLSRKRLKINNDKDLRNILRNMTIIKSLSGSKGQIRNLEEEIRLLIDDEPRLIPSIEVRSEMLHQDYQVKLVQSVFQDQQCVIMIFQSNEGNKIREIVKEKRFKETIYYFLFQQLTTSLSSAHYKLQVVYPFININVFRIILMNNNFSNQLQFIEYEIFIKQIYQIFGRTIKIINNDQIKELRINFIYLKRLIITLSQQFEQLRQIKLKRRQQKDICILKITLVGRILDLIEKTKLAKQNFQFTSDLLLNKQILIAKLIEIIKNKSYSSEKKEQLIALTLSKLILWQVFGEQTIRLKEKKDQSQCSFKLLLDHQ